MPRATPAEKSERNDETESGVGSSAAAASPGSSARTPISVVGRWAPGTRRTRPLAVVSTVGATSSPGAQASPPKPASTAGAGSRSASWAWPLVWMNGEGELKGLDAVAYVRFASVYRHFRDIGEFMTELKGLLGGKE